MQFYAFVVPGLEEVAGREIAERFGVQIGERRCGVVFFSWEGNPRDLLELGTTEDVFAVVARGRVANEREGLEQIGVMVAESPLFEEAVGAHRQARPKRVKRISYRVVAQRHGGRQLYMRKETRKALERAIAWRFPRWKRVDEEALVEVWGLEGRGEFLCGVRLSDRTMRHRTYKEAQIEASLRPTVARALVLLSEPEDGDVFMDPMCGAGTILIERGEYGRYAQLLGGDIRPVAVAATRTNIGPRYQPIAVREWDAGSLPLADDSVDRVACNLPFGRKVGEPWELRSLYERFASELERVLRGGGVAVLLTSERKLLEEALALLQTLYIERLFPVEVLGQKAFVLKLKKVI
jgi:23S rRNA G2445 N2-methylase RlmL